jgi:hypothetical protein
MWLSRCCALRIHSGQPESFFTLLIVFSNTLLETLQAEHPDWRIELVDGTIEVMSLSGYESDHADQKRVLESDILTLPELLPSWELVVFELWALEFE